MKKSKKCLYLLFLVGLLNSRMEVEAEEPLTIEDVKEKAFADLESGKKIEVGTTIIENVEKEVLSNNVVRFIDDVELGDIVLVNGIGSDRASGSEIKTRKVVNETMAVVGTKNDELYPYALAEVNENGEVGDIIGWFKGENLKARISFKKIREYADIEQKIVEVTSIWEQTGNPGYIPYYYDWYGEDYAISYNYVWPSVNNEYDHSIEHGFYSNEEGFTTSVIEYWKTNEEDKKIYRYRNYQKGTVDYTTEEEREKIAFDEDILIKNYGIKSN